MLNTSVISKGQVVVRTRPGFSTIFDQFVGNVCSFCFKAVGGIGIEHTFKLQKKDGRVGVTCPSGNKEPLEMMKTLIANQDAASGRQLDALAKVTGVHPKMVNLLIGQIRGNATSERSSHSYLI